MAIMEVEGNEVEEKDEADESGDLLVVIDEYYGDTDAEVYSY